MMDFAFLGIPTVVWIIVLTFAIFYGNIRGAMAVSEAWSRMQRNKKLPDWPKSLSNSRTVKIKVERDNAIILERTAMGGFVLKHVFANVNCATVVFKSDVIAGTEAQAIAEFDRWVAEGLSDEGRVDGFRQLMPTYTPPKPKRGKRKNK